MQFEVVNDSTENVKVFGNMESSVEYISTRLHENFTVYISGVSGASAVVERIKAELYNNLSNVSRVEVRG